MRWTKDEEAELVRLVDQQHTGESAAKILTEKFGRQFHAGGCTGKAFRMKHPFKKKSHLGHPKVAQKRLPCAGGAKQSAHFFKTPAAVPDVEELFGDDLAPAEARPLAIMQLTPKACHWPMGDPGAPGFRFCGNPGANMLVEPARPYCPYHARIAYEPSHERRRQDRKIAKSV